MMYSFQGMSPQATHQPWDGWVAETATVIGQVELGKQVSVWFGAVVRADNCKIKLGDFTNVQENAVLHTDHGIEMNIGNYVTIGHQAMLHGCTIGDNSLIGINAVILNNAVIGKNCIIGANALIPEGKVIPDNSLVMGSPGKVVKSLDEFAEAKLKLSAMHYAEHYKNFIHLEKFEF
ncbi:gamma carbonic anhydrase family protein [Acinetobacter lanii]|uniref:Gamma carbonic anhydrase family protein n=1 Tax=Acinetobacter lanii TaxID=2715163 RepID=A0A6G8S6J7_9GAMM|nr:gamma carbonic anhydrase family protein [Acinetobacter lanii]QIO09668.1 gamma carbonic anhydrase family protein [Acinetobacter lanii]